MRYILILLLLVSTAYGQSSPTSAKTRFVNGLYMGTKLDSYFNAADSNAIYWRADSVVMAKYKGTARALAFASALGSYKLVADTFFTGGYTTRARLKQYGDSLAATKLSPSDSATYFNQVVRTFGTQTVGGNKTFSNDITVNGVRAGRGAGNSSSNTVFGSGSLNVNTSGTNAVAIGLSALAANTIGADNVAIGVNSMLFNTQGERNTAIGNKSAIGVTPFNSASRRSTNSVYIGFEAVGSDSANSNETVIGANAIGNGSNTVTIGNSSVTGNYFNGFLKQTSVTSAVLKASSTGQLEAAVANTDYAAALSGTSGTFPQFTSSSTIGNSILSQSGAIVTAETGGTTQLYLKSGSGNDAVIRYFSGGTEYATVRANSTKFFIEAGAGGTERFALDGSTGYATSLGFYNATVGATNRDVFVDNTGLIGYVSSFRASKKNIAPLSNTSWLHNLNPVTFNYRIKDAKGKYTDSAYKEKEYGLVAEEVENVNPEMVFYDVDSTGKHLRGVHYSKLIIPLLKEIQDQKKKLDLQKTAIEALIKRIELLEKR
jgi:hypothetical protein